MSTVRRVLICGGRDYHPTREDALLVRATLERFKATVVIHGGARGVDTWAGRVAGRLNLETVVVLPDYNRHGRGAPFVRNIAMLDMDPVAVLALPGGNGTAHTYENARKRGIPAFDHPAMIALADFANAGIVIRPQD